MIPIPAVQLFENIKRDIDIDFVRIGEEIGDIEDDPALGAEIVSYYSSLQLFEAQ